MATLRLKPNSRKTPPLILPTATSSDWEISDSGVLLHSSGFSIQFFSSEECEIINIPNEMSLTRVRELTTEAMKTRNKR